MNHIIVSGITFHVTTEPDHDAGTPWDRECGHGDVRRLDHPELKKRPGERTLTRSKRGYELLYDFAGAVKIARRDGWGLTETDAAALIERIGRPPTAGDIAAEAARLDFERTRAWCNDEWGYVGVIVTAPNGETDSVWGVESDGGDAYIKEIARDLAEGMAPQLIEQAASDKTAAELPGRMTAIAAIAEHLADALRDALPYLGTTNPRDGIRLSGHQKVGFAAREVLATCDAQRTNPLSADTHARLPARLALALRDQQRLYDLNDHKRRDAVTAETAAVLQLAQRVGLLAGASCTAVALPLAGGGDA